MARMFWSGFSEAITWCLGAGLTFAMQSQSFAQPRVPTSDEEVLEEVVSRAVTGLQVEVRDLEKRRLESLSLSLDESIRLARALVALGHRSADSKDFGRAEAALKPWWKSSPPAFPEVLILKTRILMARGDLEAAQEVGYELRKLAPDDPRGRLLVGSVLLKRGRFADALHACAGLPQTVGFEAAVCLAVIEGRTGQAKKAYQELLRRWNEVKEVHLRGGVADELNGLALMSLAELALRVGEIARAEDFFKQAVNTEGAGVVAFERMADFLLDHDRPAEVLALLAGKDTIDALLLRLALAAKAAKAPEAQNYHIALQERLQANRGALPGVQDKIDSRYFLELAGDPKEALKYAKLNWGRSREPEDLWLLAQSAAAAKDLAALGEVKRWLKATGLEENKAKLVLRNLQK